MKLNPWQRLLLGIVLVAFLIVAFVFAAVAFRNVQQWNAALKLRRQVEATGGEAEFMQVYGADFCPLSNILPMHHSQSAISFPVIRYVRVLDQAPAAHFREIEWSRLPKLRTSHLKIHHPEFSDSDLNSLPHELRLVELDISSTAVTNAGIDKIKSFSTLGSLSLASCRIDSAGLVRLATETKLAIRTTFTAADLQALGRVKAVDRITGGILVVDETFRAEQLHGLNPQCRLEFRGSYEAEALSGIGEVYKQDHIRFRQAELHAANLSGVARMPGLKHAFFWSCTISGALTAITEPMDAAEPPNPERTGQPLFVSVWDTKMEPNHLKAFANTTISVAARGQNIDDDWFHAVMSLPHVDSVELDETAVTDAARAKYETIQLRTGLIYRRPAKSADSQPNSDCP